MSQRLSIELTGADSAQARDLAEEIESVEGVEFAGTLAARSVDPASLGVWLQLATTAVATAGAAAAVVEKVLGLIRKKGISGVLKFPDGTSLTLDNISAADLTVLLEQKGSRSQG